MSVPKDVMQEINQKFADSVTDEKKAELGIPLKEDEPGGESVIDEDVDETVEGAESEDSDEGAESDAGDNTEPEGSEDIRTIAQLAAAIEVEPEFLYSMEIGMGDGEDPVPLGELKDKYSALLKTTTQQTEQITEQSAQLNQANDLTQLGQGVSQEMVQAFSVMDAIKQRYAETDWARLEQEDPGEAALMKRKFQESFNEAQSGAQTAQRRMQEYKQANMQRAGEIMVRIVPEWQDVAVRRADQAEIRKMLIAEGSNDEYINQIADPVAMKLLRELYMLRAEKAAATKAVQKVYKAPKSLKSGGRFKPDTKAQAAKLVSAAKAAPPQGRSKAELAAVKALLAGSVKTGNPRR